MIKQRTKFLTINGIEKPLKEWAKEHGIPHGTLHNRVVRGWPISRWLNPSYAAKGHITRDGYRKIHGMREHIAIAENALGKPLPANAVVHHHSRVKHQNNNANLVICQDSAYHNLLHRRMDALAACGNPSWRICRFCHHYDDPAILYISADGNSINHRACLTEYVRRRNREQRTRS